ncbi:mite group 2 allergen Gly d 2.02 [Aedes aegypti]|uniref:ML domain-containing protein n=1 Tax=Aedes aegypti TaxID=7159 RepID=A0A1S4EZB9_AEDAE|nr:mite group 2 allergen Gly d 2.02 [Aedes aegypti]
MFKFVLVAALVPALALANVNFRACPNRAPTPTSLKVNDCYGDNCVLVARKPLRAQAIGIVSRYNSNTATIKIIARFLGKDVGYRVRPELTNACKGVVGGCPIVAGRTYNFVFVDEVLEVPAVNIPVEIEVSVSGDRGVVLGCVRFDAWIARR